MNLNTPLHKILFLDIETVPAVPSYNELDADFRQLWDKKAAFLKREGDETPAGLYQKAGIFAEFGKIVCISVGVMRERKLRIKSFAGKDEGVLLNSFASLLNQHYSTEQHSLCAHNGKEFDFPYICRRMLVNGIKLPHILQIAGKRPWEVKHIDTLELWKFGDYKHYTSLELLAALFGIPTPKDDIDGSEVGKVFWEDDDLERIVTYCQKDVLTIVQLFQRYRGQELLSDDEVEWVE